ncbi:hypothetical protein QLX08_001426 [Tetragonisca angustula]|uniref:Uncharacterized protein n=1 Tax=Tetragonisca angustula TaxID=166442 RepID=A0AAW1AFI2_9HYME
MKTIRQQARQRCAYRYERGEVFGTN